MATIKLKRDLWGLGGEEGKDIRKRWVGVPEEGMLMWVADVPDILVEYINIEIWDDLMACLYLFDTLLLTVWYTFRSSW